MCAALNMHHPPPQTYSRLFRPWDMHKQQEAPGVLQSENCANTAPPLRIKTERSGSSSRSSSSRSSSISSSSSSSVGADGSSSLQSSLLHIDATAQCAPSPTTSAAAAQRLCGSLSPQPPTVAASLQLFPSAASSPATLDRHHPQQQQQEQQMQLMAAASISSANEIYYAAAAAAAAAACASAAGIGMNVSPPPPGAAYMDPYTLGCMEQEYARIMAEEAHLKALNARKQRPKKFKCPHCDVAFSNNGQLKGHIRIHTGERPFRCDVETCAKTFTRNEELTRHKRIHSGLRPYPCGACGKKFGRRDHLKKHMKTHLPQERQLGGGAIFVPMYPYLYGY